MHHCPSFDSFPSEIRAPLPQFRILPIRNSCTTIAPVSNPSHQKFVHYCPSFESFPSEIRIPLPQFRILQSEIRAPLPQLQILPIRNMGHVPQESQRQRSLIKLTVQSFKWAYHPKIDEGAAVFVLVVTVMQWDIRFRTADQCWLRVVAGLSPSGHFDFQRVGEQVGGS